MPRTSKENLIPKADALLIRAFPKVAYRLESQVDDMDKAELDAYLKLLPGAVERFQAVTTTGNDLPESIETAVAQLVTSFGAQNTAVVELSDQIATRNTALDLGETAEGESDPDRPEGSDTDQSVASMSLSRNEVEAPASNSGEAGGTKERPRNARVRTRSPFSGRMAGALDRRVRQAESADD